MPLGTFATKGSFCVDWIEAARERSSLSVGSNDGANAAQALFLT